MISTADFRQIQEPERLPNAESFGTVTSTTNVAFGNLNIIY